MLFLLSFLSLGLLAHAQSLSLLGDLPLAVKTPYLHSWARSNSFKAPKQVWPNLFTQNKNVGWAGIVRVDGQPYQWLGDAVTSIANFSNTVASTVTPTKTIFTIQAGHMRFNATFFSPIEANDYTRQSIPFIYLFVDGFTADDGMSHTVQMYSDISGEWVSHDPLTKVVWGTENKSNMIYHHVAPEEPRLLVDNGDSAEDGTGYYATPKRSGLTWRIGVDVDCRTDFSRVGSLQNSEDTQFRAINDSWPVFSLAIDLGSITPKNQPDPVVWALGLVRDPLVNYATESGFQDRTGYYWSVYQNIDDVISDFLVDFPSARQRSQTFDDRILNAAFQVSSEYAAIVSLVTRQIFASMDITIPTSERGKPSPSDVKIFMKDISVSARANPVEVIYAALPALLYLNASFAHDLLLPLLEFQSSSAYHKPYASPDLGTGYPTIGGNTSTIEELAIEHCGNMLIMTYAHAVKSGDTSLISKFHPLLQKWAEYLVPNSLRPNSAILSPDGFGYPDMSNLALKGILGVYSMGKIDEAINPSNTTFRDKANELIANWTQLAVTDTHIQAIYGKTSAWGLMYNLFPAVWLQTGLIADDVLDREALYYSSKAPPVDQSYSLDSESGNNQAYPHWALMTAAIIPSGFTSVRDTLIKSTYLQAYNVTRVFPLPMRYKASTGLGVLGSTGSPAQGAAFGILAMAMTNVNISSSSPGANVNAGKESPGPAIVGGVVGGIASLLIIASAVFFWRRRRTQESRIGLRKQNSYLHPFISQSAPGRTNDGAFRLLEQSSAVDLNPLTRREPLSELLSRSLHPKRSYSRRNHRLPAEPPTPPIPQFQPLSSKPREALQQNQPSESAMSTSTSPHSEAGSGREDVLRAEVDELRREMEAIRSMAQPPPSYQ